MNRRCVLFLAVLVPLSITTTVARADLVPGLRLRVYEIGEDGRVVHIHAGGPSITYVEGCL